MILGFLIAQLMNSSLVRTKITRTFMFLPHVLSMVAVSMIWLLIYDPAYGHANLILKFFGISPSKWLQNPDTALISIIIMSVWKGIGYNMIINLAGLQNIPSSFYEVADLDGANYFQKTWKITLPMMSPTTGNQTATPRNVGGSGAEPMGRRVKKPRAARNFIG